MFNLNFATALNNLPISTASENYSVVHTGNVLQMIQDQTGYVVRSYNEAGSKLPEKFGKTKHLVRLAPANWMNKPESPEIVFLNSFDKTTAFKLFIGRFRIACMNGIIAGDFIESFKAAHYRLNYDRLGLFLANLGNNVTKSNDQVDAMKSKIIAIQTALPIAKQALELTHADKIEALSETNRDYLAWKTISHTRRHEDTGNDAWSVLNRVQENILRGIPGKLRKVTAIDKNVKVNRYLYDAFAQIAS